MSTERKFVNVAGPSEKGEEKVERRWGSVQIDLNTSDIEFRIHAPDCSALIGWVDEAGEFSLFKPNYPNSVGIKTDRKGYPLIYTHCEDPIVIADVLKERERAKTCNQIEQVLPDIAAAEQRGRELERADIVRWGKLWMQPIQWVERVESGEHIPTAIENEAKS